MTDPAPTRRRSFSPEPAWLIFGLLVVEGLLWLSERYTWFWFNEKKGWTVLIAVAAVGGAMLLMLGWFIVALVFRWRFQFSIRSLLVLTVAIAIPCSWLAVEMKKASEQRAAVEAIAQSGGSVTYDYELDSASEGARPKSPAWLRIPLGDDFFQNVVRAFLHSDVQMERLKGLTELRGLSLAGTRLTDGAILEIAGLTRLQTLDLDHTDITDAGLQRVATMIELKGLFLDNTKVTNIGLANLAPLTQLAWLDLGNTQITDEGLEHITGLTRLRRLDLVNAHITDNGLRHVAEATQLQFLLLYGTQITDAGLAHIARLTQLQALDLDNTHITDAGLERLEGLSTLQELWLANDSRVTDAGLTCLGKLSRLRTLYLRGTKTTAEGVKKLQQALPNCKIYH